VPLIFSGKNGLPYIPSNISEKIYNHLKIDVLLMQIQSGSVGLNLQQMNRVYFTSPHWNPAIEDQAIARCYRYGQKRDVKVTKLVSVVSDELELKTFEQRVLEVQETKRELQAELLEDDNLRRNGEMVNGLTIKELEYLMGN
jgi:SNF2 family DNA or RNA helicase